MNNIVKNKVVLLFAFLLAYVSCDVDNPPPPINSLITNISFSSGSYTIQVNYGQIASISVNPNNINVAASDITIESTDSEVASAIVTKSTAGLITISIVTKKVGTATLTLKIKNSNVTGSVNIIVTADAPPPAAPVSLGLTGCSVDLYIGKLDTLNTNIDPKNAKDTSVTWSTDNGSFVSVSDKGVIKALASGVENVIATSNADKTLVEKCKVTVLTPATSIELSQTTLTLTYGSTATLTAKVKPDNAFNKNVSWRIDNNEIATVNNGVITPLKAGKANIIVTSTGNPEITATCELTILSKNIYSVNITEETYNLRKTESHKLTAEVLPQDADNKVIIWSSGNKEIVSVSENGTITGLKLGEAKIYATSAQNTSVKDSITVYVQGVSINKNTLVMDKGTNYNLTATVFPSTLTGVTWSSSDENIATVNANTGEVSAVSRGEVQIYATLPNPESGKPPFVDTCKISVKIYLKSITFEDYRLVMDINTATSLTPIFTPSDADNQVIKWTSEFPAVATVEDGRVEALSIGETNIKAVSDFDATITATVKVFVKGIILDNNVLNLKVGNIETINAKLYPTDLTDMTLNWESSSPDIVSVAASGNLNASGNIKALKEGTAIITVKSVSDNTITATCTVNVAASPYGVNLSHSNLVLIKRETKSLTAEIVKAGITNMNVLWTSDNEAVASVDANGLVITHLAGTANIIAYSEEDNTVRDTCRLSVNGINLDHKTLSIPKGKTGKITPIVIITKTTDLSVTYTAENAKASVDANGLITAKDTGMVHIIVSSKSNNNLKDTCLVTVQGLQFSVPSLELRKGGSQTVIVTAYPSSLAGGITWSSEDVNKATVINGTINGITYGETNIVATYTDIPDIAEKLKVSVTGIELDHTTLSIPKGKTAILKHSGLTIKSTNQAVTYTSSDPAIASVDNNGLVTAKAQGEVTVTVTFVNDNSLTATCKVIVQTLTFDITKLTLRKTETKLITATIYPSSLTGGVTWTSGSDQIASVSTTGLVTANNHGTTKITATSNDNPDLKLDIEVNVIGFTLNNKSISIFRNEKSTLTPIFSPADFSDQYVTWSSKDKTIATVISGVITGVSVGKTYIYAVSNFDNTIKDSCVVTVKGIKFDTKLITLTGKGFTYAISDYTITYTKYPSDLDVGTLIWKSDNTSKVKVNNNGLVEFVTSGGFAKVSAVSNVDDRITDTTGVQIVGVSFDKSSIYLKKDKFTNIKATIFYLNGSITEKSMASFQSVNPLIASVNGNGLITAINYGSTSINLVEKLVKLDDGGGYLYYENYSATSKIYVPNITMDKNIIILRSNVNKLPLTLIPSDLPNKNIIYENDNPSIITFNSDGTFNRKGFGTANITARYKFNTDDEVTATTTLTLYNFYLNKNELLLVKDKSETLIATVDLGNLSNAYTWSSSNENFATVSQSGLVQAVGYGQATIYITSDANPIYKDSCIVKITRNAYISEFKFEMSKNPGMQSDVSLTNYNDVQYGGDFKYIANNKLVPTFTVSAGATVKVNDVLQTSGVSEVDFTSAVNYVVTSTSVSETETFRVALNFINDTFTVSSDGELSCDAKLKRNLYTAILADSMNGYIVRSIGDQGFYATPTRLISLYINNTITEIKNQAFFNQLLLCGDLYIPPNVIKIGDNAFSLLSCIKSIRHREGITLGTNVFYQSVTPTTYTWP